jgi:hypothetical protein
MFHHLDFAWRLHLSWDDSLRNNFDNLELYIVHNDRFPGFLIHKSLFDCRRPYTTRMTFVEFWPGDEYKMQLRLVESSGRETLSKEVFIEVPRLVPVWSSGELEGEEEWMVDDQDLRHANGRIASGVPAAGVGFRRSKKLDRVVRELRILLAQGFVGRMGTRQWVGENLIAEEDREICIGGQRFKTAKRKRTNA